MPDRALKPWTIDEFFAWQSRQAERYELVNGFPVRMQVGARNVHNDIITITINTKNCLLGFCQDRNEMHRKLSSLKVVINTSYEIIHSLNTPIQCTL